MTRLSIIIAAALFAASPALAQRSIGLGGQVGDPTGVSVRIGSTGSAVDIAAGWNISNDRIFAQLHYVPNQIGLGASPAVRLFYGPGVFASASGGNNSQGRFGASFNTGLSVWTGPLEFYGQLTPRLQLVDATDFQLGGAVGLRYYF